MCDLNLALIIIIYRKLVPSKLHSTLPTSWSKCW